MAGRKLRITFVLAGRGLAGGNRVVVIYGNKLIERGHDVSIVVRKRPLPRRPLPLCSRLYRDFAYTTRLGYDHLHHFNGKVLPAADRELERVVPDGDAVLATHWSTAYPVFQLPSGKGRKNYFIQRYEGDTFDPAQVDVTWRLPMRKIVISKLLERMARERFDDPGPVLIMNGVDRRLFHAPSRSLQEPPVVGLLYSTAAFKGVAIALEAIRLTRSQIPRLRVVAFGATRPNKSLPLPSNSEFHYRPRQDRIRDVYARCDVWLCASRSEGFHLPPLEAMACRCPVVSTRVGGPLECVTEGVTGYLVDVEDAAALADRITRVLSNRDRWAEMSAASYEASCAFDWERAADLFESALLDGNSP